MSEQVYVLPPIASVPINTSITLQACIDDFACQELSLNYIKKDVLTGNPRSVEFSPHPTLDPLQRKRILIKATHRLEQSKSPSPRAKTL